MKNKFPGYYTPTKKEFEKLWDNCLFVLDANVLTNLYRYTPKTSDELLEILEKVSDRLWVPYQAALEYQRRRLNVIAGQEEAYDKIIGVLNKAQNKLQGELGEFNRHPYISTSDLLKQTDGIFSTITKNIESSKKKHPDLLENDTLRSKITRILKDKVGPSYKDKRLDEIAKEGESRFEKKVPPGFMDETKNDNKYGDLILWFQTIDKAKEVKKPVILITDDAKEDWWWKFKGRTLGPRSELVEEIKLEAGVQFYMYSSDQFMEHAREYLKQTVDQSAIDEVKEISKQKETSAVILNITQQISEVDNELDNIKSQLIEVNEEISLLRKQNDTMTVELGETSRHILNKRYYGVDMPEQQYIELLEKRVVIERDIKDLQLRLEQSNRLSKRLKMRQVEVLTRRQILVERYNELSIKLVE